ncbi:hypothetical protein [Acaryochloris marina]|uniref:hypothetical protein n=1 Tax=Acaryochloris marina TaxID=155978 RepID=UPI0021C337E4|nr:hypothetical protein [Acaryochloris marina]BDM83540.1 hypothetical protein AM10699_64010 [Acaryochloris marina MBIC10699]
MPPLVLCEICQLGQPKEFTPEEIRGLSEVIQRRVDGANSYAEAYDQLLAEVTPAEVEPVDSDTGSDGVEQIFEETQQIAKEDHDRVINNLHGYGGDLQDAVVQVYLTEMNALFQNREMRKAIVTEAPEQLAKKPGLFTSRAREFLAAQAKSAALPPSATSLTETSSPE